MQKVSPWIIREDCALRHIEGADPDDITKRVALIEKSPRVRIRPAHYRIIRGSFDDEASSEVSYRWEEHLDWCYGPRGDGPEDEDSQKWCDGMLKALGYQLTE